MIYTDQPIVVNQADTDLNLHQVPQYCIMRIQEMFLDLKMFLDIKMEQRIRYEFHVNTTMNGIRMEIVVL